MGDPVPYGLVHTGEFFTYGADGEKNANMVAKPEWLTNHGLRVELYYANGRLLRLFFKGRLVPVEELHAQNIIPEDFWPHIGVRLLKSNVRVEQAHRGDNARQYFKEAFDVFNRENEDKNLGLPRLEFGDPGPDAIYFKTYFTRMAENLAILQNIGHFDTGTHASNVTLAAEIVDIDGLAHWSAYREHDPGWLAKYGGVYLGVLKQTRDACNALRLLCKAGQRANMRVPSREELANRFISQFRSTLNDVEVQRVASLDPRAVERAVNKIANAVLIEDRNLSPLKSGGEIGNIQEWDLGF